MKIDRSSSCFCRIAKQVFEEETSGDAGWGMDGGAPLRCDRRCLVLPLVHVLERLMIDVHGLFFFYDFDLSCFTRYPKDW